MTSNIHIATNKIDPRVAFTHNSLDSLVFLLEIYAAHNMGVSSRYSLTADQKAKYLDRFDFSVIQLED